MRPEPGIQYRVLDTSWRFVIDARFARAFENSLFVSEMADKQASHLLKGKRKVEG